MDISKSDVEFLLDLFKHIPPSHVALFLRLIRLYPMNIVNDSMKREQNILAIINETISTDYKANIWPKIMSINRIPELVEQVLLSNEDERLVAAIAKLQLRFELQPHRFIIHQLVTAGTTCFICHNRLGEPKFDELSNIITRENIYSCVMYKKECCDLIYKYGHVRNRRTRERFVTPDVIFNQKFLHLFDHVVYECQLLVAFTNLFHEAATSFQSYSNATNSKIDQNRNSNSESVVWNKLNPKFFSVVCSYHLIVSFIILCSFRLQTWTWFEICRYLFFMTDLTMIQIPDIIQRLSHDLYYEVNTIFFYELFVKFWSHHNQAQSCQCQPKDQCMLNFVFDTHMKAHRLVCAHTGSCDESIVELRAVAVGCPRMPLRSSSVLLKNMTSTEQEKCKQYCELHYKYGLELNIPQNLNIEKALELDQLAEEFDDNDICTVHRDNDDTKHKRRTAGFMAVVSNCNVIIGWGESVRSEGMRRWIYQLLKILYLGGKLPPAAAYDSACTFIAYLRNQYGVSIQSSSYADELMHKKYCIDRFHRRNHVRPECKTILSCEYEQNKPYFDNQNTQETFIQPSFHDRQPNAFTSSPDIRSILHLHDRIPFTKLTEPRPDNHVDNEFNLKLPNSKQMNLIEPPRADHIVNQLGSESKSSIHVNIYFQPCLTQTKLFFHSMNLSEPPLARPIENEPDIESKNTNQINLAEPPRAHRILNELGFGWKKSNQINFPEPTPARRIENELAFEWGKSNQIEPSRAHRIENEPRLESKNSNQLNLPEPPLADRIEYQLGLQSKNSNQIYLTEPPRAHRIQNELCVESKKLNQIHLAEAPCAGRFEYELGFESNHSIQINPAELRHDVHVCDQSFSELHYRNHKLANYTNGKKNSAHVHELFTSSYSA
ncbi:unnamed protein product [Rotaria magnacalcarata]|uniref:Uncharacterized protein n=1 Tax=Rotaria magnacalcarata TaxID=392030 RepID=A0A816ZJC9_9BILA|nr:unnamed protein product [Rotaria magnacalcarata]